MITTNGHTHPSAYEFRAELAATPPGKHVIYFLGESLAGAVEAASLAKDLNASEPRLVAQLAQEGATDGELVLTQRRIAERLFEYRATIVRPEFRPLPRRFKRPPKPNGNNQ
jgi:hypothetical protein